MVLPCPKVEAKGIGLALVLGGFKSLPGSRQMEEAAEESRGWALHRREQPLVHSNPDGLTDGASTYSFSTLR